MITDLAPLLILVIEGDFKGSEIVRFPLRSGEGLRVFNSDVDLSYCVVRIDLAPPRLQVAEEDCRDSDVA